MSVCHVDFETRSAVDLRKTGVHVYAEDISTDVWCLCYAFGDEPVQAWRRGDPPPERLLAHVRAGGVLTAHNAPFERATVPSYEDIAAPQGGAVHRCSTRPIGSCAPYSPEQPRIRARKSARRTAQ